MKKLIAVLAVAGLGVVAGCNNTGRVESTTATEMKACEKGSACCKVTGNKADCKSSCSESSCADKAASCGSKN